MHPAVMDAAALEKLISAASAAPSVHGGRPWCFRLDPDTLTLQVLTAAGRGPWYVDPTGRALHLSAGAALFHLRVAAARLGWEPSVRLLPRPEEPALLAAVRCTVPSRAGHRHRPDLYDVLWRRTTSRFPFSPRRPPCSVLAELQEAAHAEGAVLTLPDRRETTRLLRLTADAERRELHDAERREFRLLRDGVPRPRAGGTRALTLPRATGCEQPLLAVLSTGHDRRADWLRAGQALAYVLLAGTVHGVRASLLHQALEWNDLRWAVGGRDRRTAHAQMLLRLGYGPEGPAPPRRGPSGAPTG